jgi:hypothetical protein
VSAGWADDRCGADGGLIPGVYGWGKISVATEMAYVLKQRSQPYALLDMVYLTWADTGRSDRAELGSARCC